MYTLKKKFEFCDLFYDTRKFCPRQEKSGSLGCRIGIKLLFPEGHAVGALVHSGIGFVGAHQDPVQGAVVLILTVVRTLLNGAFDALVCVIIHNDILLLM